MTAEVVHQGVIPAHAGIYAHTARKFKESIHIYLKVIINKFFQQTSAPVGLANPTDMVWICQSKPSEKCNKLIHIYLKDSIIEEFERITGVGAILNTSFNLHGEPIVCNVDDALYTFKNSDLDGLILDGYLILRKRD